MGRATLQLSQSNYETLVRILDAICKEAAYRDPIYRPERPSDEKSKQARCRAYLHLYLKVTFGLLDFDEREQQVTDGHHDGGIDAYHIDEKNKTIFCVQGKFAHNAANFQNKQISVDDLVKVQLGRILKGETIDAESKQPYNERIRRFQKRLSKLQGRYQKHIVLLGNTTLLKPAHLERLFDVYPVEHFDFACVYKDLVFPVAQAAYYNNPHLIIRIDQRHAQHEKDYLDYLIKTKGMQTEVKLLFVPTEEIGRILYQYRNSILKYNPRSFLEFQNNPVNKAIRDSISARTFNEFALFNNGITMIADEATIDVETGKKGWARLDLTNPHIINGGQTAYVLSRLYEDREKGHLPRAAFNGKEVLLRVVRLGPADAHNRARALLIDAVSKASNEQSKVDEADRRSNEPLQLDLQRAFFEKHGLFYERKRGEFADGIKDDYVRKDQIVKRDLLMRVALATSGKIALAKSGIKKFFTPEAFKNPPLQISQVSAYVYGYQVVRNVIQAGRLPAAKGPGGLRKFGAVLRHGQYALVHIAVKEGPELQLTPEQSFQQLLPQWKKFERWVARRPQNATYFGRGGLGFISYYKGATVDQDIGRYRFALRRQRRRVNA